MELSSTALGNWTFNKAVSDTAQISTYIENATHLKGKAIYLSNDLSVDKADVYVQNGGNFVQTDGNDCVYSTGSFIQGRKHSDAYGPIGTGSYGWAIVGVDPLSNMASFRLSGDISGIEEISAKLFSYVLEQHRQAYCLSISSIDVASKIVTFAEPLGLNMLSSLSAKTEDELLAIYENDDNAFFCPDRIDVGALKIKSFVCNHAEGGSTKAIGQYAHAEGRATIAEGKYSHAEGHKTFAASSAHAEGFESKAFGDKSHVEGLSAQTAPEAEAAHAEGYSSKAYARYAHAEGVSTNAKAQASHAEGERTAAEGKNAHAEGNGCYAKGANSHAEGMAVQAVGENSHAEGNETFATAESSHAEGVSTNAKAQASHAEGDRSEAHGHSSHAEGNGCYAKGASSHAEGCTTQAVGSNSHAEGINCLARGSNSHAQGDQCEADGTSSFAGGTQSKAKGDYSTAIGNACETGEDSRYSFACGANAKSTSQEQFVWNGDTSNVYNGGGAQKLPHTFSVNPKDGINGFFIGSSSLSAILSSFAETVKTEVAGKLATDLNSNKFVFGAAGPKYDFDDEISGTGYNFWVQHYNSLTKLTEVKWLHQKIKTLSYENVEPDPAKPAVRRGAFQSCPGLSSLNAPYVEELQMYACATGSLKQVNLPKAKSLATAAFQGCSGLSSLELPAAETIGNYAFDGCRNIQRLAVPNAKSFGSDSMRDLSSIQVIDFSERDTVAYPSAPDLPAAAMSNINAAYDYKIVVPDSMYDAWIASSAWSSAAIKPHIVKASEFKTATEQA